MLRKIRLQIGISMQRLASKAGLSRPTIERAERGHFVNEVSASRIASAISELAGKIHTVEDLGIKTRGE